MVLRCGVPAMSRVAFRLLCGTSRRLCKTAISPTSRVLSLCGLKYVDVDIVDQLVGLQAITDVEFQAERVPTDVQDVTQESRTSHADELFKLLEQS